MKDTADNNTHEVAIFWDFSSRPAPSDASGCQVSNALRGIGQRFGSIKLFKVYLPIFEHSSSNGARSSSFRSELQASGASLTDIPANNNISANVSGQMITVDMFTYAMERPPTTTTVVLITEDELFSYAISTLRLRNYRTAIIGSDRNSSLLSQGAIYFDWTLDVLQIPNRAFSQPSKASNAISSQESPKKPLQSPLITPMVGDRHLPAESPKHYPDQPMLQEERGDEVDLGHFLPRGKSRASEATETPEQLLSPQIRGTASMIDLDDPMLAFSPKPTVQPRDVSLHDMSNTPSTPRMSSGNSHSPPPSVNSTLPNRSIPAGSQPFNGHSSSFHGLSTNANSKPSTQTFTNAFTPSSTFTNPVTGPAPAAANSANSTTYLQPPLSLSNVPSHFQILVQILRTYRLKKVYQPSRSNVAIELVAQDKDIYKKAGVERFAQYSALAEKGEYVILGNLGNGATSIELHPKWR